jgi:hypothetical protein
MVKVDLFFFQDVSKGFLKLFIKATLFNLNKLYLLQRTITKTYCFSLNWQAHIYLLLKKVINEFVSMSGMSTTYKHVRTVYVYAVCAQCSSCTCTPMMWTPTVQSKFST